MLISSSIPFVVLFSSPFIVPISPSAHFSAPSLLHTFHSPLCLCPVCFASFLQCLPHFSPSLPTSALPHHFLRSLSARLHVLMVSFPSFPVFHTSFPSLLPYLTSFLTYFPSIPPCLPSSLSSFCTFLAVFNPYIHLSVYYSLLSNILPCPLSFLPSYVFSFHSPT